MLVDFYRWKRGDNRQLSTHFNSREFECKCTLCMDQAISAALVNKLEELRVAVAMPIKVTSGYRCSRYQEILRQKGYETAKGRSSHEDGIAADISATDMDRLYNGAYSLFDSLGRSKTFIHVDMRVKRLDGTKRIWEYR